jgi:hypothetical protein
LELQKRESRMTLVLKGTLAPQHVTPSNSSRTRHNAQTCKKDTEAYSKLDASTTYVGSLFNSNKIKDV